LIDVLIHEAFNVLNLYLSEFHEQNLNFNNQQTKMHMLTFALNLLQLGTQFINQFFYSTLLKTTESRDFYIMSSYPYIYHKKIRHLKVVSNTESLPGTAWLRQGMKKQFCLIFPVSCRAGINTTKGYTMAEDGFGGLVVSVLVSGSRVHGFKPGRSRWIFQM
jgi:hypothetical protein